MEAPGVPPGVPPQRKVSVPGVFDTFPNMAIKTGLLDLTSDSDTVAEVVLSQWEIPIYLLEMEKTFPPHYINISRKCTFQFQVCA